MRVTVMDSSTRSITIPTTELGTQALMQCGNAVCIEEGSREEIERLMALLKKPDRRWGISRLARIAEGD